MDDSLESIERSPMPCEQYPVAPSHQQAVSDERPSAEDAVMEESERSDDTLPAGHEAQESNPNSDNSRAETQVDASITDDVSTIHVIASQRAIVSGTSLPVQSVNSFMSPGRSTPASDCTSDSRSSTSYMSHSMSPATSVGTHITWPNSSGQACIQDANASNSDDGNSYDEDISPSTLLSIPSGTRYEITEDTPAREGGSPEDADRREQLSGKECIVPSERVDREISPENPAPTRLGMTRHVSQGNTYPPTALSLADMDRLVPRLAELERQGVEQHIAVPQVDITLSDLQSSIGVEDGDWQYTSIRYEACQKDERFARVYVSHDKSSIDWSAFTAEVKRPTIDEAKAIFEKATQDPPTKYIPYYVGHANGFPHSELDPGPVIMNNPAFKDLHTPYHHIGGDLSAHCCHCEDMTSVEQTSEGPVYHGLRSYSEVYFGTGYKLWLVIARHHVGKFDKFVRLKWSCNPCNQGIRHECLLFAPSLLDKEGIDYIIAVVGRGEAFWTTPGQQHQIINFGHCAARSINFSHPEDGLDLAKAIQCHDCGMFEVGKACGAPIVTPPTSQSREALSTAAITKRKRQPNHETSAAPSKRSTRTYTAFQHELDEIDRTLRGIRYRSPVVDQNNLTGAVITVYKFVAAVQSELAIQQFVELVDQLRKDKSQVPFTEDSTKSPLDNAIERVTHYAGRTKLDKFCLRLSQINLAKAVDEHKGPRRKQVDTEFLSQLASRHNMTKEELKRHLRDGNQWSKLCGNYNGLLAFIFLDSKNDFGIKKEGWIRLSHDGNSTLKETFHGLFNKEYINHLLTAGKALEEKVYGSLKTFKWEGSHFDLGGSDIEIRIGEMRD
ncbi:unnamed protein product [Fusarium langsethiae]|nr:unnamed protein product [Fusarium langsethiae]